MRSILSITNHKKLVNQPILNQKYAESDNIKGEFNVFNNTDYFKIPESNTLYKKLYSVNPSKQLKNIEAKENFPQNIFSSNKVNSDSQIILYQESEYHNFTQNLFKPIVTTLFTNEQLGTLLEELLSDVEKHNNKEKKSFDELIFKETSAKTEAKDELIDKLFEELLMLGTAHEISPYSQINLSETSAELVEDAMEPFNNGKRKNFDTRTGQFSKVLFTKDIVGLKIIQLIRALRDEKIYGSDKTESDSFDYNLSLLQYINSSSLDLKSDSKFSFEEMDHQVEGLLNHLNSLRNNDKIINDESESNITIELSSTIEETIYSTINSDMYVSEL